MSDEAPPAAPAIPPDTLSQLACAVARAQAELAAAGGGSLVSARISLVGVAGASRQVGLSGGLMLGMLPLGIGVQVLHGVTAGRGMWVECELRQVPPRAAQDEEGTA